MERTCTRRERRCHWGAPCPYTTTRAPVAHAPARSDYAPMPHLDQFALSELASESEPLGDYSEEQAGRFSAEREMADRDRREGRGTGRGVRRPGALLADDDGACAGPPASGFPANPPHAHLSRPTAPQQTTRRRGDVGVDARRTAWLRARWRRRMKRRAALSLAGTLLQPLTRSLRPCPGPGR